MTREKQVGRIKTASNNEIGKPGLTGMGPRDCWHPLMERLNRQDYPVPSSTSGGIDLVNVSGSVVSHAGTKIQADVVNILPKATRSPPRQCFKSIFLYSVAALLPLSVVVSVYATLLVQQQSTTTHGVGSSSEFSRKTNTSDSILSLNDFIIVSRELWGGLDMDGRIYLQFQTVSIDNLPGKRCNTTNYCMTLLLNAQRTTPLNYNFLIGDDGRAYEARGWNDLSDYSAPYSTSTVKIGFIGSYETPPTAIQNKSLYAIFEEGIANAYLSPNYFVIPQCCRGLMRSDFGPDEEILKFYSDTFINKCYTYQPNCKRNRGEKNTSVLNSTLVKPESHT